MRMGRVMTKRGIDEQGGRARRRTRSGREGAVRVGERITEPRQSEHDNGSTTVQGGWRELQGRSDGDEHRPQGKHKKRSTFRFERGRESASHAKTKDQIPPLREIRNPLTHGAPLPNRLEHPMFCAASSNRSITQNLHNDVSGRCVVTCPWCSWAVGWPGSRVFLNCALPVIESRLPVLHVLVVCLAV